MMQIFIVSSEVEANEIVAKKEEEGLILACVSNTGLMRGKVRLTFLPKEVTIRSEG